MLTLHEQFVTDSSGKRVGVLLDIETYQLILNELRLVEILRAPQAAQLSEGERVAIQQQGSEALQALQQVAAAQGLDQLSADDIQAEIQAARAARHKHA